MSPLTVASQELSSIQIPLPTDLSRRTTGSETTKERQQQTWTYQGYSRAGTATSFVLVEPKWIFDCGCIITSTTKMRPTCIFITHTHADHIQTLHQMLFSQKPITKGTTTTATKTTTTTATINANTIHVYFPAVAECLIFNFLLSYYEMIRDDDDDDDNKNVHNDYYDINDTVSIMEQCYNFRLHPVQVNDEFTVPSAIKNIDIEYIVRIVECSHRKVCIGYSIYQKQRIYKEPYRSMSGIEFGKYMKANSDGTAIPSSDIKEWSPNVQPILCFLGDTTTHVFTLHPELLQHHTVVAMECTYYYGTINDENSNVNQHTYWDVLRTNILQHYPNILFVLQHFSNRHRKHEWIQWIYDYNQSSQYYNVHPMLVTQSLLHLSPPNSITTGHETPSSFVNTKSECQPTTATDDDVLDVVPMNQISIHDEISFNPIASIPGAITTCRCFLCEPSLKSRTDRSPCK